MTKAELPKLDKQVTEFLSEDEMQRLNDVLESWPCRETVAFIRFAMLTGVRRGELFKLTWADIDFDRYLVTLREPKGGKTETIPVNVEALAAPQQLDRALLITSSPAAMVGRGPTSKDPGPGFGRPPVCQTTSASTASVTTSPVTWSVMGWTFTLWAVS
ncbi:MAG: tyrosine-type recombinase/integrase [Deltaproteobacteria bacterium]|nr:tyrosine-type recombinase/integrase [Deltaproteobacteria bacterium]